MGELHTQLYRNHDLLLWVKMEFDTIEERNAALKTFAWIKKKYPEAIPIIRGDLVAETKEEA
jgi:hypothetical protein